MSLLVHDGLRIAEVLGCDVEHFSTRAYDRSRHSLDRQPTYAMAAQLHRTPPITGVEMRRHQAG